VDGEGDVAADDVVACLSSRFDHFGSFRCESSWRDTAAAAEHQPECLQSAAWRGEEITGALSLDWVGISGISWADD